MKNKLKFLALLLILPAVFVFAGCGQLDGDVRVNTGDDNRYQAVTAQAITDYVEDAAEEETDVLPSGAKMTVEFEAGEMAKGKVNVIFKTTEDADENVNIELAVRADVNAKIGNANLKAKADAFYKEDVLYVDANVSGDAETNQMIAQMGINGKHKVDLSEMGGLQALLGMAGTFIPVDELPIANIAGLIENFDISMLAQYIDGFGFDVSSYTDGDYTRFKLAVEDQETGDAITAYAVFVKGVLAGIKVDAKMTNEGVEMKVTLNVEAFEGNIDYPNFNDFADFDADLM